MGLRGKLIGVFLVFFSLMVMVAMTLLHSNLAQGFAAIEQQQAQRQMQQVTRNLDGELDRLNQIVYDWASWDALVAFARHPTQRFADSQIVPASLKAIDIKLVVILSPKGESLYAESVNLGSGQTESAAMFDPVVADVRQRTSEHHVFADKTCGIDQSVVGPMLLCWKPVVQSDLRGEPAGTLIVGRLLDSALLEKIKKQSDVNFELAAMPAQETPKANPPSSDLRADQVEFSPSESGVLTAQLQNIVGVPALKVRLMYPNDVSERGASLTWQVAKVLVVVTLLTGAALLACVHYLVIRRLRKIDTDLASIWRNGRWAGRLDAPYRKDELTDLSHSINRMLALIRKQVVMLESIALTDALTQIANRRAFEERLQIEMSLHHRNHTPLSLLMVDVDYFKRYNDRSGHPAGDEVLKAIGNLLGQIACRPADMPARIGGEEFAVILPATELDGACHVAEQLQAKLAELKIVHEDSPISQYVTLSIGVTTAGNEQVAGLIQRVDKAMYSAKQTGRNKVCALPAA